MKLRKFLLILLVILLAPIIYSYIVMSSAVKYKYTNPEYTKFMLYRVDQAKKKGQAIYAGYSFVPLKEMPQSLLNAVVFAEDGGFYQHHGVDWKSLATSYQENLRRRKIIWGGSTITMQLCKNLFLYPKRTYLRKFIEIILAKRLELGLSKERILELYLNLIEWGPGIYGSENAAEYYFAKSVRDLDEAECAFLAAIIMSPRAYNFSKENPFFKKRQQWVFNYLVTGQTAITENAREAEFVLEKDNLEFADSLNDQLIYEPDKTEDYIPLEVFQTTVNAVVPEPIEPSENNIFEYPQRELKWQTIFMTPNVQVTADPEDRG